MFLFTWFAFVLEYPIIDNLVTWASPHQQPLLTCFYSHAFPILVVLMC